MNNFEHIATLPNGYDGRTKLALTKQGVLVIAHPEQLVRYLDGKHWLQVAYPPKFAEFTNGAPV